MALLLLYGDYMNNRTTRMPNPNKLMDKLKQNPKAKPQRKPMATGPMETKPVRSRGYPTRPTR